MRSGSCTLVAIARNEEKHILEWLAYHLEVGFDRILVFDNASADSTFDRISEAARHDARISVVSWPSPDWVSPQCTAYNHALTLVTTPWVGFLDIDEFVVPWRDGTIDRYLVSIPDDISAVHVNWRSFGSSGLASDDYPLVTEAFTRCASSDWYNQQHYKTFARRERVVEAFIHYVVVDRGRRVLSDFQDVPPENEGIAHATVYAGIQVNHYQAKTLVEFQRRMKAGDAYYPDGHPAKSREASSLERFQILDRNEECDDKIAAYLPALKARLARLGAKSSETPS